MADGLFVGMGSVPAAFHDPLLPTTVTTPILHGQPQAVVHSFAPPSALSSASAVAALSASDQPAGVFTHGPRVSPPRLDDWSVAGYLTPTAPILRLLHLTVDITAVMAPRSMLTVSMIGANSQMHTMMGLAPASSSSSSSAAAGGLGSPTHGHQSGEALELAADKSLFAAKSLHPIPNFEVDLKIEEASVYFSEVCGQFGPPALC